MKAEFIPTWITPARLPDLQETQAVDTRVEAKLVATLLYDGNPLVLESEHATRLTTVRVGGVAVQFSVTNQTVTFTATKNALVELVIEAPVTYSLVTQTQPPGIVLSDTGELFGTVGHVSSTGPASFNFVIRAKYGTAFTDQQFTWAVTPKISPMRWSMAFPPHSFEETTEYYQLGQLRLGQKLLFPLTVINPDEVDYQVKVRPVIGLPSALNRYNGVLPVGISVTNSAISGSIKSTAVAGDYFFEIFVDHVAAPEPIPFKITVISAELNNFSEEIESITWPKEDLIGTVREGFPAHLKVQASERNDAPIIYQLAPNSPALPEGLELTKFGEISGLIPYMEEEKTVEFVVRAISGTKFLDKQFRIKLVKLFSSMNYLDVHLKISGDFRELVAQQVEAISPELRFRAHDDNFRPEGTVLVITGLSNRGLSRLTRLNYRNDLELVAGELKLAKAMDGHRVAYEVVYREMIDPLERAGGFVFDGNVAIPDPVINPQDKVTDDTPPSIRNIRADLVNAVGLESIDPFLTRVLDLNGGEGLPLWMISPQGASGPLGYVLSMVEGYAPPGKGVQLLEYLQQNSVIRSGQVCTFDRFVVGKLATQPTTFDVEAKALPVVLPANISDLQLGRWCYRVSEVFTLDGKSVDFTVNRASRAISIPPSATERSLIIFLKGFAEQGYPLYQNSKTTVTVGSYSSGIVNISEDNVMRPVSDYLVDHLAGTISGIGAGTTELTVHFTETSMVDNKQRVIFDVQPVLLKNYEKFKDTLIKSR